MSPRKDDSPRLADHASPLPPSMTGRGTDAITDADVAAFYTKVPDTGYGIGSAGVAVERAVVFEDPLTARLDEQGEVPL